jgi:hypothetical protein
MRHRKRIKFDYCLGIIYLTIIIYVIFAITACGTLSLNPRSNSIFALQFSDQPPRNLIDLTCNGIRHMYEGVAVCEQKTTTSPRIYVKIMPTPGRVIFSDGLSKKPIDFNYRKGGWIWKQTVIDTTWVPIDIGEVNSIFGDVPIAFDVQGITDAGIINNRGVIYTRICNDRDIPCSKLAVEYDCSGKVGNTFQGQLGSCSRMSGSSQKFRIPLRGLDYKIQKGASIRVNSPLDGWQYRHEVTESDIAGGEIKFVYPNVLNGPDLFSFTVFQYEQGILAEYHGYVLIVGFSANWTGIDRPHALFTAKNQADFCIPILADLMEINDGKTVNVISKDCQGWKTDQGQVCAYAFDRESGDQTYTCLKNGKDERFP